MAVFFLCYVSPNQPQEFYYPLKLQNHTVLKLSYQHLLRGYLDVSQAEQEATDKPISNRPKNISETGYRCVSLNARSIVNKKNELNIMVEDIDPHIIGITESWANR